MDPTLPKRISSNMNVNNLAQDLSQFTISFHDNSLSSNFSSHLKNN